jgi:formate dehydrogenase alpha subunit
LLERTIKITVDGQEVIAYSNETYLETLQRAHIYIPTMCYEKDLTPSGSCRLCVIEIENIDKLVSACTTPVVNNSIIYTFNERIKKSREVLLELILADHPLICTVCDKQGNCKLQELSYEYVPAEKLKKYMDPEDKTTELSEQNEFFKLDYSMCIKCGKCVQAVEEIQMCGVLSMQGRGVNVYPTPGFGRNFKEADCVGCGNCVSVCPVAALVPNTMIHGGREVDCKRTVTTCVYCGVGCQFELVTHKRDNKIVYVDSHRESPANGLALCVKGKFGNDFIHHNDRINVPYIRKNGILEESSWEEALDLIESKFKEIYKKNGGEAFAFLSSAKCTNEENYLMQKLARAAFKTNNIDHCARLCHASTVTGLARTFGSGAMTNSIDDLTNNAKVIFIIGSNTTEAHPVIGIKIKQAVAKGLTKLIVADPRAIEITESAEIHLQHIPGTDLALINAMMMVIIEENLYDESFILERTEGFEELKSILSTQDLQLMANITGIPLEKIRKAARLYAKVETSAIVYAMGITQHFTGTYNVASLASLAMMTGNVGRPGTGVNPLRGQNNVQGACDLGALPDVFPGYQKVDIKENRKKFEQFWNTKLTKTPGLTVVEIMHEAYAGNIKAMMIMGENPALSDPNISKVIQALNNLEFLVVQDLFISETGKYADVILPAKSFAEKEGTFTNTERRVQIVRPALRQIGQRKTDWEILNELLIRFGFPKKYDNPSEIMEEFSQISQIYGGISYDRIQKDGLQWPCIDKNDQGTPILHVNQFTKGKGQFLGTEYIPAAELPDDEYPFILTTGRNLYHFHTGEMTRRSKGLDERHPIEKTEINPNDAQKLGINNGDKIRITSRRGTLTTIAKVTDKILEGIVFMTFHFKESRVNLLTNDVLDPFALIPELKVASVKVEILDQEIEMINK